MCVCVLCVSLISISIFDSLSACLECFSVPLTTPSAGICLQMSTYLYTHCVCIVYLYTVLENERETDRRERSEETERLFAASESSSEGKSRGAAKAQGKPKLCGLVSALTEV